MVFPVIILCLLLGYLLDHERIASFTVGPNLTINVYAEGAFHYEPPGYLYFEVKEWGDTRIQQRRFMGIGPERKPSREFELIATIDDEVVALTLDNEVQMIHEFSSGFTWPDQYTRVTEIQWRMTELLLQQLQAAHPKIRCPRQDWYRKTLDRIKTQKPALGIEN